MSAPTRNCGIPDSHIRKPQGRHSGNTNVHQRGYADDGPWFGKDANPSATSFLGATTEPTR
jgi:hypothetical protein